MNPYQLFKMDSRHEQDGINIDYGDFAIRIARAGGSNERYAKALSKKLRPYRRQMQNDTMDNDVANKILAEVYADTVIVGWSSKQFGENAIPDAQNGELKYTRENVIQLLLDLPDLFRDIQEQATKFSNFRVEEIEEAEKNL